MARRTQIEQFFADRYRTADLDELEGLFEQHHTLTIRHQANGLVPAAPTLPVDSPTGYQSYWLRDNALIAHALLLRGEVTVALRIANAVFGLVQREQPRLERIVRMPQLKEDVQERPHVRFPRSGASGRWSHAQNDALGYVLKLRMSLANIGHLPLSDQELQTVTWLVRYLGAIEYWSDPDSGAWEEDRKVNSSSVGAVVSGLVELRSWVERYLARSEGLRDPVDALLAQGRRRLEEALPAESPPLRRADAALLLLIFPAAVVAEGHAEEILRQTEAELVRELGVIRYAGDSYYGQDYPDWFATTEQLSTDFSAEVSFRNAKLQPGLEAQWCLFDTLLSVIYGTRFEASGNGEHLQRQVHYFNRALRQLTGELQCPELYFSRHGKWTPSPHTPLAWSQANLALAVRGMRRSAALVR